MTIEILAFIGVIIILVIALPAFFRWRKTVRCPKCHKWKLQFTGFTVSDKVVGHSSSTFGGGGAGGLLGRIAVFLFGHASRTNADPFIREWGTAHFICEECGCHVEIDTKRDRK